MPLLYSKQLPSQLLVLAIIHDHVTHKPFFLYVEIILRRALQAIHNPLMPAACSVLPDLPKKLRHVFRILRGLA